MPESPPPHPDRMGRLALLCQPLLTEGLHAFSQKATRRVVGLCCSRGEPSGRLLEGLQCVLARSAVALCLGMALLLLLAPPWWSTWPSPLGRLLLAKALIYSLPL